MTAYLTNSFLLGHKVFNYIQVLYFDSQVVYAATISGTSAGKVGADLKCTKWCCNSPHQVKGRS